MKVSWNEMDTFLRCAKADQYKRIENLERKVTTEPIYKGNVIHAMLGSHYMGESFELAYARELDKVDLNPLLFDDEKVDAHRIIDAAYTIMDAYVKHYASEDLDVVSVEESWEVSSGGDTFSFTPDLVTEEGGLVVTDHKSSSSIPEFTPQGHMQLVKYMAGLDMLGYEVKGAQLNYLRTKLPTQPRLNKTAPYGLNNARAIDTTFEILSAFIQENDLEWDEKAMTRLEELRGSARFFRRFFIPATPELLEAGGQEIRATFVAMDHADETGWRPRSWSSWPGPGSCDQCFYKPLCQADLQGWNRDLVIEEQYQERS